MDRNTDNKIEENKPSRKTFLMLFSLLSTVLVATFLILSFKSKIQNLEPNNNSQESLKTTFNQVTNPQKTDNEPIKEEETSNDLIDCQSLQTFMQEYYNLKLIANQGADFNSQLLELNKYKLNITNVKPLLSRLLALSNSNKSEDYFKNRFQQIIKEIYIANSKGIFFDKMIFIRAIGDRALSQEGLDKYVELSSRSLFENNLASALEYMELIPNSTEALKQLEIEIRNKLTIKEIFGNIDQLFVNNLSCKVTKG